MPTPAFALSRLNDLPAPIRASFWVALAAVGFPLTITCVRHVVPEIPAFEAVMFRSVFGMIFMFPWLARRGVGQLRTTKTRWFALRGACAFFVPLRCRFRPGSSATVSPTSASRLASRLAGTV